jgi:predicted CoA-binding protein
MDWQENIIEHSGDIKRLLSETKRIAVLGIKTEQQAHQPAFYVPQYMAAAGYEIIPVPVYYPEATRILGQEVYRRLVDVPGEIDMVNVFRRPQDIGAHIEDILAKRARAVWLQSGIRHDAAAEQFARAGILVVQDRCLMVEHRMAAR